MSSWSNAVEKLEKLFAFKPDPYIQDWDLERADGERLSEFIFAYKTKCENSLEKQILMSLILASYDDLLCVNSHSLEVWESICEQLKSDVKIHQELIDDWSLWNEPEQPNRDNWHRLTPIIRSLQV